MAGLNVVLTATLVCQIACVADQVVNIEQTLEQIDLTPHYKWSPPQNFSFASYYSDHMVLQRAPARAVIWGYSPHIGETITVKQSNRSSYQTTVYKDPVYGYGTWRMKLPAESTPGPFSITAMSSHGTIQLQDVLFGDVWLCSGQSNMQFTISQAFNSTAEIADADNYPDIRLMTLAEKASNTSVPDVLGYWLNWRRADKASVGGRPWSFFSAVCWLYGKGLYKELGYPIGLISSSWGGTMIEPWSSHEALAKCGLDQDNTVQDNDVKNEGKYDDSLFGPKANSEIWNSMVHPLLNMTIYGVLWYQGESNSIHNVNKYSCTFPALIDDWRLKFHVGSGGETDIMFPFGFVQIGPAEPDVLTEGYSLVRWHQTADYGYTPNPMMKRVFMAVAVDMSDFASPWHSVHYRDKQDVAARLLLGGLSVAYHRTDIHFQGPLPSHIIEGNNNVTLLYNTQIIFNNHIGFEARCRVNGSKIVFWMESPILSTNPDRITLLSGVCGKGVPISGIRYLWSKSPCPFKTCTVYSADNPLLPGPPFVLNRNMTGVEGTVHTIDWDSPVTFEKEELE